MSNQGNNNPRGGSNGGDQPPMMIYPGAHVAGRYEIVKCLGAGNMGLVYLCRHLDLPGLQVAMKVLSPANPQMMGDPNFAARFLNEISATYRVSHKNVVCTYDFIREEGIVAYTMEYVAGSNLAILIRSGKKIDIPNIIRILFQICCGVEAIHEAGIIHRDLKPANILISDSGEIKITDFGIARTEGGTQFTARGGVVGTINYLSPEYLSSQIVERPGDIYAIGVLAYELITQRAPFKGASLFDSIELKLHGDFAPPNKLNTECPEELSQLVAKALSRQPENRFQSATEMLDALIALDPSLAEYRARDVSKVPLVILPDGVRDDPHATVYEAGTQIFDRSGLTNADGGEISATLVVSPSDPLIPGDDTAGATPEIIEERLEATPHHDREAVEHGSAIEHNAQSDEGGQQPNYPLHEGASPENSIHPQSLAVEIESSQASEHAAHLAALESSHAGERRSRLAFIGIGAGLAFVAFIVLLVLYRPSGESLEPDTSASQIALNLEAPHGDSHDQPLNVQPAPAVSGAETQPMARLDSQTGDLQPGDTSAEVIAAPGLESGTISNIDQPTEPSPSEQPTQAMVAPVALQPTQTAIPTPEATLAGEQPPVELPKALRVRAQLLYKLADYVRWPAAAMKQGGSKIEICILGHDPFGAFLDQKIASESSADGRAFHVVRLEASSSREQVTGCQVAYLGNVATLAFEKLPVLTMTDGTGLGIIDLFELDGKVKFSVNANAAKRVDLTLDDALLSLATKRP